MWVPGLWVALIFEQLWLPDICRIKWRQNELHDAEEPQISLLDWCKRVLKKWSWSHPEKTNHWLKLWLIDELVQKNFDYSTRQKARGGLIWSSASLNAKNVHHNSPNPSQVEVDRTAEKTMSSEKITDRRTWFGKVERWSQVHRRNEICKVTGEA